MNILLCFDTNYNIQAEVTMTSLLNNTRNKVNFYIIHDDPQTFTEMSVRLKKRENTKSVNIYKFEKREEVTFPNFDESHMTEATYYRLFIGDYLPKDIDNIMYIDPDIICVNNFDLLFKTTFEILNRSDFVLSARTEHYEKLKSETAERLELTKNKYFNAGVTFINYQKWLKENYTEELTKRMNYLGDRVMWYDQDVLNSFLNGMYNELPSQLNFTDVFLPISEVKQEAVLYHYWGKKKPWTMKGILFYGESFYQQIYRDLNDNKYHIVHRYKRDSILHFLKFILSLKIFTMKHPIKFISSFYKSFKS